MKKICSILFFLLASMSAFSQDILVYKNGDEIKAVVTEVNTSDVKYKKWDNQTGPSYTVLKNELFMIKYKNGSKDVFKDEAPVVTQPVNTNPVNTQPVNTNQNTGNGSVVLENRPPAPIKDQSLEIQNKKDYDMYMSRSRHKLGTGIAFTAAGGGLFLLGAILTVDGLIINDWDYEGYGDYSSPLPIVGTIIGGVGLPFLITGPIMLGKSRKYREKAKSLALWSVQPSIQMCKIPNNRSINSGITLTMTF